MSTESDERPADPWRFRPVMWNSWAQIHHVVVEAELVGDQVHQRFACGGMTLFGSLEITSWHAARKKYPRICRRCVELLAAAGETGPLGSGKGGHRP